WMNNIEAGLISFADFATEGRRRPDLTERLFKGAYERWRFRHDHAVVLRLVNPLVDVDRLPLHEQTDAFAEAEEHLRSARDEHVILVLLVPAFNKIHAACLRSHADLRCATSALAAERFCIDRNRWPESLTELVPQYL